MTISPIRIATPTLQPDYTSFQETVSSRQKIISHLSDLAKLVVDEELCTDDLDYFELKLQSEFPEYDSVPFSLDQFLLFIAVNEGDVDAVQFMILSEEIDLDLFNHNGDAPLHITCSRGDFEIAEILLSAGSEINQPNFEGNTSLVLATRAQHEKVVDLLVENKADAGKANSLGYRPLHEAARTGNLHNFMCLIAGGADPEVSVSETVIWTPLHILVHYNHKHILSQFFSPTRPPGPQFADYRLLESYGDISKLIKPIARYPNGALKWPEVESDSVALDSNDRLRFINSELLGMTLLHRAATLGHVDICRLLLDSGAQINFRTKDKYEANALELAAIYNQQSVAELFVSYVLKESPDDLNAVVCGGGPVKGSAFKIAIGFSHYPMVTLFLKSGISLDADEINPLLGSREPGLLSAFLSAGYPVDHQDSQGRTVLHYSVGADSIPNVQFLISAPQSANLSVADLNMNTVLHFAARLPSKEMCQFLLNSGAHGLICSPDTTGSIPLHTAVRRGRPEMVTELLKNPNLKNEDVEKSLTSINLSGLTPLFEASINSLDPVVEAMLPHHSSIQESMVHYVALGGFEKIFLMLHRSHPTDWKVKSVEGCDVQELLKTVLKRIVSNEFDRNSVDKDPINVSTHSLLKNFGSDMHQICNYVERVCDYLIGQVSNKEFFTEIRSLIPSI
jgi:ankyrin